MSIREYAAHRRSRGLPGGNKNAVDKALKAGRITRNQDSRIDPDVADREWEANSDPSKMHFGIAAARPPAAVPAPARRGHRPPPDDEDEVGGGGSPANDYARSRALREEYLARTARIEYEQAAGNLVPKGVVSRETFRRARDLRNRVLAVPARLKAILAHEGNPVEVERILLEDLVKALEGTELHE